MSRRGRACSCRKGLWTHPEARQGVSRAEGAAAWECSPSGLLLSLPEEESVYGGEIKDKIACTMHSAAIHFISISNESVA